MNTRHILGLIKHNSVCWLQHCAAIWHHSKRRIVTIVSHSILIRTRLGGMISFRRNGVIFSPFVLLFSQCIVFRLTACDVQYSARVRKCHSFCRLDYCFFFSFWTVGVGCAGSDGAIGTWYCFRFEPLKSTNMGQCDSNNVIAIVLRPIHEWIYHLPSSAASIFSIFIRDASRICLSVRHKNRKTIIKLTYNIVGRTCEMNSNLSLIQ